MASLHDEIHFLFKMTCSKKKTSDQSSSLYIRLLLIHGHGTPIFEFDDQSLAHFNSFGKTGCSVDQQSIYSMSTRRNHGDRKSCFMLSTSNKLWTSSFESLLQKINCWAILQIRWSLIRRTVTTMDGNSRDEHTHLKIQELRGFVLSAAFRIDFTAPIKPESRITSLWDFAFDTSKYNVLTYSKSYRQR